MQNDQLPSSRKFVNRREVATITGISIPALAALAEKKAGPVCRIPDGYSENKYELDHVLGWMRGEKIPPWPDNLRTPKTRRGANLRKNKGPGRPNKKPQRVSQEGDA